MNNVSVGDLVQRRHAGLVLLAVVITAVGVVTGGVAAKAREIHLTTLVWEPYYGPDLPNDGFCGAITKAAFERVGHSVKITYVPWARALRDAAAGRYDGILGGYYTKERAKDFYYSEPFAKAQGALIAPADFKFDQYDTMRDLEGHKIAVANDFAYSEAFDNADYLNKMEVNRTQQIIHMLFKRRVDMAALSVAVFRHQAKQLGYENTENMKMLEPLLFENDLFVMMSKAVEDGKELRNDFDEGLAAIKNDGTYADILERYGQVGS